MAADDPFEWVKDLRRVVGDKLMKDIVDDFRSYNRSPRSMTPPATVQIQGAGRVVSADDKPIASTGTGWVPAPKVDDWKPPGLEHMDRMMDQADAIDRAERIRKLAEASAIRRAEVAIKQQEPKERKDKESK
jgi:hypothetical protein